ncbi:hypothetical protein NQ315_011787 [Exocentrus adspersus]|uniref:Uncharacterized protein n=1 Tax=Exocentrus adspersus TaxID=1586481 RepID=A0AAV8W154_9CUCU|nr:hypothetical protein NQ315_011787 [Exocentrus adspersus]
MTNIRYQIAINPVTASPTVSGVSGMINLKTEPVPYPLSRSKNTISTGSDSSSSNELSEKKSRNLPGVHSTAEIYNFPTDISTAEPLPPASIESESESSSASTDTTFPSTDSSFDSFDNFEEIVEALISDGAGGETPNGRYSISKVQIKPGRPFDPNQNELAANYLSRLPNLKEQAAPYTPMPYTFRVSNACNRVKIRNMWARCPPFHLLLDHTIAVVWLLFAQKEYNCPLGISQLQWALAFLKTIHTRQGDRPKDVEICISTIENILVDAYAELASELPDVSKLDASVRYVDGALGTESMVMKSIPFSLNYAEMVSRRPRDVEGKTSVLSMTSAEAQEELNNLKEAAGVESIENLDSVSKHKAINVLKAWKTEQLQKIRGELKRLRSIEDKMKDIDDNFEGYLEDDLEMLYTK